MNNRIIGVVVLVLFSVSTYAQIDFEVKITYPTASSSFDPFNPMSTIDETGSAMVAFLLQIPPANVESIEVELRRTGGGDVLIEKSFAYGVEGQLGDGTTYTLYENVIELDLGSYNNLTTYQASVQLVYIDGQKSAPILKHKDDGIININWGQ